MRHSVLTAILSTGLFAAPAVAQTTAPASEAAAEPASLWSQPTLSGNWGGVRDQLTAAGVTLGLQEQSEGWTNLAGGLRRGAVYDGLATASIKLDLQQLAGWTGATIYADALQIRGRGPSVHLVGNLQTVSSIEATRGTRLYALWFEQEVWDKRFSVRVGQEGTADELMVADLGAVLVNSSFGNPPLDALGLPSGSPNYPLAAPMVRVKVKPTPQITLIGAVFSGDPAPPGPGDPQRRDASGTAFRLNDHTLSFLELWYAASIGGLDGTYKIGGWYHSGSFADLQSDAGGLSLANPAGSGMPRYHRGDHAIYAVANQMVWRPAGSTDRGVGVFGRVVTAPSDRNLNDLYLEAGLNWTGPLAGYPTDIAGLAVGYAHISRAARALRAQQIALGAGGAPLRGNETVLEATYQHQVAEWWTLQPDLQYVVNPGAGLANSGPGGPPVTLKNAWVVGLRTTLTF